MEKEARNLVLLQLADSSRRCGAHTCIHCLNRTCTLDGECDMYERRLIQEG
jgi:hypothetical protein